jgi:hypothetical protein
MHGPRLSPWLSFWLRVAAQVSRGGPPFTDQRATAGTDACAGRGERLDDGARSDHAPTEYSVGATVIEELGQLEPDLVDRDHAELDREQMRETLSTNVNGRAAEALDVAHAGASVLSAAVTLDCFGWKFCGLW